MNLEKKLQIEKIRMKEEKIKNTKFATGNYSEMTI